MKKLLFGLLILLMFSCSGLIPDSRCDKELQEQNDSLMNYIDSLMNDLDTTNIGIMK